MPRQGNLLSAGEVHRITLLLVNTDMTIAEIAERVTRSKSTILSINNKFMIREYRGRSHWIIRKKWHFTETTRELVAK